MFVLLPSILTVLQRNSITQHAIFQYVIASTILLLLSSHALVTCSQSQNKNSYGERVKGL